MNVREATAKQRLENVEISNLKAALGLQAGKDYENTKDLRYGHVIILTDADDDGSHIKGLVINWLHYAHPSLLKIPGFLKFFRTPIVKATKGKSIESFYTLTDYNKWKEKVDTKKWEIKYYKGLGTSTSKEAKGYFQDLDHHLIDFTWDNSTGEPDDDIDSKFTDASGKTVSDRAITLGFAKDRAQDRKEWLQNFQEDELEEVEVEGVSIPHFVHNELIRFSAADNMRSLPGFDGLKPSQRKVLFCALNRLKNKQMKVAQFSGIVSADSGYHHGEASLMGVIVSLAQDFVGSNNINYLEPKGQFGSRVLAGKDAASPRYIFTQLEKIAEAIFHPLDNPLLHYLDDDGTQIEPKTYYPVIPMILINGSDGIGTGYSTFIPPYNPVDVMNNVQRALNNKDLQDMLPWFSGANGKIRLDEENIIYTGKWERETDTSIMVTDLPPLGKERATQEYINYLEKISLENSKDKAYSKRWVSDYENYSTDYLVRIRVIFASKAILEGMIKEGDFEKKMKLQCKVNISNMHTFNHDGKIIKYADPLDILREYIPIRLAKYVDRKEYMENKLDHEIKILSNKIRFLGDVADKRLLLVDKRRKKKDVETDMDDMNYFRVDDSLDYLLNMPISSFTDEKLQELEARHANKMKELEELQNKTPQDLWKFDLKNFSDEYKKLEASRAKTLQAELDMEADREMPSSKKKRTVKKSKVSPKKS